VAGELSQTNLNPELTYAGSACLMPEKPDFSSPDTETYQKNAVLYEAWVSDINAYVVCLQNEMRSDMALLQQRILEFGTHQASQAQADVDAAKAELDAARNALEQAQEQ
jgi:hypothetical protein